MWFLYAFAVVAGALNSFQSGANGALAKTLGQPFVAALLIVAISASGLLVAGLVSGHLAWPEPGRWGGVPPWAWVGGVLGAIFLASQFFVAQQVGAGFYIGLTVTAAVVVSLGLDHYGLMGFEEHPAGPWRIVGAGPMVAGVGLVARS